jgi:hypothetical protein
MPHLLKLLKGLFRGSASVEPGKLGSDGDPIRQMLFGSQSLQEQVQRMRLNGSPGPLQTIAEASKLVDSGKRSEAIACLRGILDSPNVETRVQLWVWSALRGLGEMPEPKYAFQVLGAIIETPVGGAYDTLAAYVDGTARYLNYSGKAIFWDAPDPVVKQLCEAMVSSTIPASGAAKPRTILSLPRKGNQVTLLTRSGAFVVAGLPTSVEVAGAALMKELIRRATETGGTGEMAG